MKQTPNDDSTRPRRMRSISARLKKPRQRMTGPFKRGVYLLPSVVTSLGLAIGFYSMISGVNGHLELAAILIMVAFLCDGLDGRLARVSQSASPFGVEYDSLADVVAFGAAPATLLYVWALRSLGAWGWVVCAAFVVCAALRLARFNVQAPSADKRRFVGLPVPGAAIAIAALVLAGSYFELDLGRGLPIFMTPFSLALACLMISSVPYPSFKGINLKRRVSLETVTAVMIGIGVAIVLPQVTVLILSIGYVLSGPFLLISARLRGKAPSASTDARQTTPSRIGASTQHDSPDILPTRWLH
jgi:CDP-diacylglycerol--serine O-phosphatidyltransferase